MSNDTILSKIELLEEQIENVDRSGHFTEKETNRLSLPLREELESLKKQLNLYGMDQAKYKEGVKMHRHYFSQMHSPALINTCKLFGMNLTSIQG